ncbi:hypothetical protein [Nesterenkonia pannonica]|uniref:hypothetical protein n=1 Tax=Nesterenkonia pannonica TaxID=1548602 RepID=UPI002164725B|nr:hypothetical protein [Nesterenkonia pannonica]
MVLPFAVRPPVDHSRVVGVSGAEARLLEDLDDAVLRGGAGVRDEFEGHSGLPLGVAGGFSGGAAAQLLHEGIASLAGGQVGCALRGPLRQLLIDG